MAEREYRLRPASNADGESVIQLIDGVYREYGERMHLEQADRDLLDLERAYAGRGGSFVVLEGPEGIVGCHATLPVDVQARSGTFRRLYLSSDLRGRGWGDVLMAWAIDWAMQAGWERIEFWSDTRFTRAHRFFGRFRFQRTGEVREMHDSYEPYSEFKFVWERQVKPVQDPATVNV